MPSRRTVSSQVLSCRTLDVLEQPSRSVSGNPGVWWYPEVTQTRWPGERYLMYPEPEVLSRAGSSRIMTFCGVNRAQGTGMFAKTGAPHARIDLMSLPRLFIYVPQKSVIGVKAISTVFYLFPPLTMKRVQVLSLSFH